MTLDEIKKDYYSRKEDVNLLYKFIKNNEEATPIVGCIMKASLFLILYNLVEDTVRKLLCYILEQSSSDLKYQDIVRETQKLLLLSKKNKIICTNEPESFFKTLDDIIQNCISNISHSLEVKHVLTFQKAGNIDSKAIKGIYNSFGYKIKKESELINLIKDKRCALAHGEISFQECGKGYATSDLLRYKKEVFHYLGQLFVHTSNLLKNKTYIKKQPYKRVS